MQCVIAEQEIARIREECLRYPSVETGGVLVGARLGDDFVVTHTIPAGPEAFRSGNRFAPDVGYQQAVLNQLHARYEAINYLGDWHKHPGRHSAPSSVDLGVARSIFDDKDWGKNEVIFAIATTGGAFQLLVYYANCYRASFQRIALSVVPTEDRHIQDVLAGKLPDLQGNANPWESDFRWYYTDWGRKWLPEAVAEIDERGWCLRIRILAKGHLAFEVARSHASGSRIVCCFPQFFPIEAPCLYRLKAGKIRQIRLAVSAWNSERSLTELLAKTRALRNRTSVRRLLMRRRK